MTKNDLLRSDVQSKLPLIYFMLTISIMHICNVMAFKIVTLFGYQFAFTGIFFPFSFLLLTVLNESYGHVETERHVKMNRKFDNADIYDFGILYNPIKMYKAGNYGENYFSKNNA